MLIYPTAAGEPRAVPSPEPGFTPLRWCRMTVWFCVATTSRRSSSGRRMCKTKKPALWKELVPPNRVGLLDLTPVRVSPDCQSYAYSPLNVLSQVYLTSGLR